MAEIRLGMSQINATVGDFAGNREKIIKDIGRASEAGCDIVVFPELSVTGYPPEDLLFKPQFIRENRQSLNMIAAACDITAVVGFVDGEGQCLYNAAAIISGGDIKLVYRKIILPNYGVFDEQRYFKPGNECPVINIGGVGVGVNICEDIWFENGPAAVQASNGAELIINISSSPFHTGKWREREDMLGKRARDYKAIVSYINQVGGQDELVFDGGSVVMDIDGTPLVRAPQFDEAFITVDIDTSLLVDILKQAEEKGDKLKKLEVAGWKNTVYDIPIQAGKKQKASVDTPTSQPLEPVEEVYRALVTGTRDYVIKNGFAHVVIGLSGGMDSSLVAAIAVDALGRERVTGVAMPSCYSSQESLEDARELCNNLKIDLISIPIEKIYNSYLETLEEVFSQVPRDTTEENIQARIRGNLLMALSNKFGWLVLTTGNKSEMATGYTTLYGDMAGGFAVIKDVPKTLVYKLGLYRNRGNGSRPIPEQIMAKAPSAELRPNQKDSDSLPLYEVLDPILTSYVEQDKEVAEIIAQGFDAEAVKRTARLVDMSEYKRRQAPPGVKITSRAFGRDRRLPITNRFRGV
ncbi:MAG: NAD+ synthase [Dehalococcoidales bacterium]|jgi:NAD+ synthase (glutamine-hydrolysing)|nr:NAD+ synthase [Dehalococcoidales bacterium]MDD3264899.1 NAD+ synthase [Dehalococcoidales bacterium]MDD4322419.1 NAD+ synthase [Dehalococcoidales bacterium]MDD4794065.1 NAD+ synthase [Dehalococcoidales bacterium]MDD5498391.1 NAD+ synthase [Dehalococcoidales bacterium]